MEQVQVKWLTISEYRLMDKKQLKEKEQLTCTIVSFPLPNAKGPYTLGVYFYPDKKEHK
jgi:hypothetical protein